LVSGVADSPKALQIDAERPLILVADDNSDMLAYLSKLLKGEYRVRVASNGLQALLAVRELNPDLVVTDIMMPGLDGLGLLQAIRNDPATAGKPVILLSARAGEEARIDGLQAGADDYIIKPFSARELLARVSAALALAKVRREAADRLEEQVRMRTQELEHRNAEVLEQSEQLRELSACLLHAQDDERRRIARELHDSAGQTLAALSWNLSHIAKATQKDPEAAQAAKDSKSLVNDLTQEIRTISYLLHPPLLDESGLSSALRWYVDGLNQRSGIAVDLELSKSLLRLSPELELAIFRIVQECLTNIHRHSESKTAKIRIEQNSETLLVEVKDQGKGIAPDALSRIRSAGSGVGIRGMSERIRHFGGVLDIKSNRGGTKVVVKFPVPKSVAARAH
jgi:signal transduction histidine kinase